MRKKIRTWLQSLFLSEQDRKTLNDFNKYNNYASQAVEEEGMNDKFLYDFKGDTWGGGRFNNGGGFISVDSINGAELVEGTPLPPTAGAEDPAGAADAPAPKEQKIIKIAIKPKDVVDELEKVPTHWSLEGLDAKIAILKSKETLLKNNHYSKREVSAMIECVENRKKFVADLKVRDFFNRFDNTNDEKIDKLLGKYKFVMKTADLFIPEFPDDAIQTMKDYTEQVEAICGKKPIFYVIAEESKFKKAYEKRDPILLAQSPFGFYWQILGAWDEEMQILSEL